MKKRAPARRASSSAATQPPAGKRASAAREDRTPPAIVTRDLTPRDFPLLERLFGDNGACAGCWCMWWRLDDGEQLRDIAYAEARRRQKALVEAGRSRGVLAFAGDEPVGWAAWAPRTELPRLARSRTLACDDPENVISLPCFFVKAGHRGQGVSTALLQHALASVKAAGGRIAEAYPVALGRKVSNSEAFTGTVPFFERAGFVTLTKGKTGRQRARKALTANR
jgi:GNAT superfamily N-acetyltransferase